MNQEKPDVPELDELLRKTAEVVNARRRLPEATYRLQFHKGFTFRDSLAVVPYLRDLGITHVYASPFLQARPGSMHGYDITNHNRLNPEIGSPDDFRAWVQSLHEHGLGQILDMVPNHMGIVGNENPWWNDILENGAASPYGTYFDIGWHSSPRPGLRNRVLLPVLGEMYGKVLEAGQLQLRFENGAFAVYYFEHRFPLDPLSYGTILTHRPEELKRQLAGEETSLAEFQSILTSISHLPPRTVHDPVHVAERQREKEIIKRRLADLVEKSPKSAQFVNETVALFNGKVGDRHSFDPLDQLLDQQAYRLSFWRVAADEINYRRFFDVNELAALNIEREEVFEATHEFVLQMLVNGDLDGLRIDHPDGLYDPRQYLQRLQQHYILAHARNIFESPPSPQASAANLRGSSGQEWQKLLPPLKTAFADAVREGQTGPLWRPLYVVVEKILSGDEPFPQEWSAHGTSGYDFLSVINGVFVNGGNSEALTNNYYYWINDRTPFSQIAYEKKLLILQASMASQLQMLAYQLDRLAQKNRWSRDFTLNSLRRALREVIACFPIYRTYSSDAGVRDSDRRYIESAVLQAQSRNPDVTRLLFRFVNDMLLLIYPEDSSDQDKAEQRHFAGKFQQVSAPVMAKGVEDTSFYVFSRLLSLNEVGGDPAHFGTAPAAFHHYLQERQAKWPYALSPLSTHDTKRSEDVRARINVLSELPDEWSHAVGRWSQMNAPQRKILDGAAVPDANEQYFLYQTLIGAWPLSPASANPAWAQQDYPQFVERIRAYMRKATYEAKVHSSWLNPNAEYDEAIQAFITAILDPKASLPFLQDFNEFQQRVSHFGMINSLAQTLLRIAAPGVPDTYQGTELWDFSLVDPDNRRPVDYARRREMLRDLQEKMTAAGKKDLIRQLMQSKEDGRLKLFVTWQALSCRRDRPGLFSTGSYEPLEAVGPMRDHIIAFLRRQGDQLAIVVVPRLVSRFAKGTVDLTLAPETWQETRLIVPELEGNAALNNVFTGEKIALTDVEGKKSLLLRNLLAEFPLALIVS